MSGNKNMAEYINFEGKTNKRIVQAPGGASSFSLAWSNQPTDYGPDRHYRKPSRENISDHQPSMRIINDTPKSYGSKNMIPIQQYEPVPGGQYGYSNYNNPLPMLPQMNYGYSDSRYGYDQPDPRQGYGHYGIPRAPVDQLQIAVNQLQNQRGRHNNMPLYETPQFVKPSIQINGPSQGNNIFGKQEYNYWKDKNNEFSQNQIGSKNRIINQDFNQGFPPNYGQGYNQENQGYIQKTLHGNGQKTSIKIHNPPGGKQNFSFG